MNGKVIERMGALLVFSIFLVMSTYTIVFSEADSVILSNACTL